MLDKGHTCNSNAQSKERLIATNHFQSYKNLFSTHINKLFLMEGNQESDVRQAKPGEEILNNMSKRRFMHSPSLDNLKQSFKVT